MKKDEWKEERYIDRKNERKIEKKNDRKEERFTGEDCTHESKLLNGTILFSILQVKGELRHYSQERDKMAFEMMGAISWYNWLGSIRHIFDFMTCKRDLSPVGRLRYFSIIWNQEVSNLLNICLCRSCHLLISFLRHNILLSSTTN